MKIKGFQDTMEWYNKNAPQYAKSIQKIQSIKQIGEFVQEIPKGAKILDAGCASGRDTKLISDKGFNVIGIDLSHELINIARKNNPNIEFIEGNFLKLPFSNNFFGGVWARASLLHFETIKDVVDSLKEFHRVLMSGGIIHIYVKEKIKDEKFDIIEDSLSHHKRFFQYFTMQEIEKYVTNSGFTILKLERHDSTSRSEIKWLLCLAKKK